MEIEERFLNFPIVLLDGFLDNHIECLAKILEYSIFEMVHSEKAKFRSIDEFVEQYEFQIDSKAHTIIKVTGKILYDSCYGMNYPWTGIHIETLERFFQERTQFDLVCLLAFLAMKSIIQMKPFCNTKNDLLLSRMAGFAKARNDIPENITHWMSCESRRKKVFTELEKHYKVVRAYKARGITFSINKLNQQELEFALLRQRDKKSNRESTILKRQAKDDAIRQFEEWKKK